MNQEPAYTAPTPAPFRVPHSESLNDLAAALAKAQAKMEHASKDAENPHFKSKYADMAAVYDASRAALAENGLAVVQLTEMDLGGRVSLVTTLIHASGQWMKSWYPVSPLKNDPQSLGGAVTYARRYSYSAMVGVAGEDDDGNAACGHGDAQQQAQRPPAPTRQDTAFSTEAALLTFQTAVRADFKKVQSVAELETLAKRDREIVEKMFNSPEPKEKEAANALAADYNDRLKELKAQEAAKPKQPARTVEDALQGDEIPF